MARVHVETWKTTYRGLVPDARLDQMTVDRDLEGGFGRWLTEPPPGHRAFVGEADELGVVGFAVAHPEVGHDPVFTGELGAIYVLQGWQGQGVGRRLVGSVARHLRSTGHAAMLVWVLEGNPFRRFYEKLGGEIIRRELRPTAGTKLPELAYGWRELRILMDL